MPRSRHSQYHPVPSLNILGRTQYLKNSETPFYFNLTETFSINNGKVLEEIANFRKYIKKLINIKSLDAFKFHFKLH